MQGALIKQSSLSLMSSSHQSSISCTGLKHFRIAIAGVLLTIVLTACNTPTSSESPTESQSPPANIPPVASSSFAASPTLSTSPTQNADSAEPEAVQVIRDYYSAINRQDYRQAYLAWDRNGAASGQSFEQFKQGFANTTSTTITVGEPSRVDAAAGSLYIRIPVTIAAVTKDGTQEQFRGSYALRRANSGLNSMPEPRRWYLNSAKITQVKL